MSDVKLVWVTEQAEALIADMARVSNPTNQGTNATVPRLLKYLITHKHWSPFEMASMCVEINTTRDISRQILRHRSFSFQEFSQRYADVSVLGGIRKRAARLQDPRNRQSSIPLGTGESGLDISQEHAIAKWWDKAQTDAYDQCSALYQAALGLGIAKEQARSLLPEGLVGTRLYMTGTFRSWMHYVDVRSASGVQAEHRFIAQACQELLFNALPSLREPT